MAEVEVNGEPGMEPPKNKGFNQRKLSLLNKNI